MSDHKTLRVSGGNRLLCQQEAAAVRSSAELHLWTSGEWKVVSHYQTASAKTFSAYAEATSSCKGLGSNVQYKSRGEGTGVFGASYNDPDGPKDSDARGFACSEPLQDILPPD